MVRSALQLSLISPSILTWKTIRHDPLIELFATCNKSGGRSMIGNTNLITFFYVKQLSIHFLHFYDELNLHIKSIYFLFSKRFIFMTHRNTYSLLFIGPRERPSFRLLIKSLFLHSNEMCLNFAFYQPTHWMNNGLGSLDCNLKRQWTRSMSLNLLCVHVCFLFVLKKKCS